ncbi:MAG: hypothetical protein PF513_04020 [Tenericutes bacterium]|jgi:hypothetical protein|nr:hypothetical protein [Mycoplasmatota bacterium]
MKIVVECEKCHKVHEVDISMDVIGSDERNMGEEVYYDVYSDIRCTYNNLIDVSVHGSEYLYGAGIEIHEVNVNGANKVN